MPASLAKEEGAQATSTATGLPFPHIAHATVAKAHQIHAQHIQAARLLARVGGLLASFAELLVG
jgi:hypothetical protein